MIHVVVITLLSCNEWLLLIDSHVKRRRELIIIRLIFNINISIKVVFAFILLFIYSLLIYFDFYECLSFHKMDQPILLSPT